ncbi:MAG: alpha/beta hydrolase [Chitinophagaceae bacterium]|nr:alpha/beta hydrolase [Chitinophagaceae bacterium]
MQEKIIQYKDSPVVYSITGNGSAVMLIHGFGEDSRVWEYQVEYLKESYRLILPDIPGSGKSPFINFNGQQGVMDTYAEIMKCILEEEHADSCTVIGHSMGGYIALAFAEHFPGRLNGLGLVHSTAYADTIERVEARKKGIAFIQKYGAQEFLQQSIPNLFGKAFSAEYPGEVQKLTDRAGNFSSEALVQYYNAMIERPDRISVLKKLSKPVLFMIGEEDKSVYLQDSLNQCHIPLLSLINILPNVAHMGMWEKKDQTNITLMKFLNYLTDA